jgi:DNA-directed RNA polymerase specialized sigma24 family protein
VVIAANTARRFVTAVETSTDFDALYTAYAPLLRRIAVAKFSIPSSHVDELVHDVFLTYLVNPAKVRDVRPYLIGGICNAARQYLREGAAEDKLFCSAEPCLAHPEESLLDAVSRSITAGALLVRMGSRCRETLRQFYMEGESAAAIATARGTTATYIFRLLQFCRDRARRLYATLQGGA